MNKSTWIDDEPKKKTVSGWTPDDTPEEVLTTTEVVTPPSFDTESTSVLKDTGLSDWGRSWNDQNQGSVWLPSNIDEFVSDDGSVNIEGFFGETDPRYVDQDTHLRFLTAQAILTNAAKGIRTTVGGVPIAANDLNTHPSLFVDSGSAPLAQPEMQKRFTEIYRSLLISKGVNPDLAADNPEVPLPSMPDRVSVAPPLADAEPRFRVVFMGKDPDTNRVLQTLYEQAVSTDILEYETQAGPAVNERRSVGTHPDLYRQALYLWGRSFDDETANSVNSTGAELRAAVIDAYIDIGGLPKDQLFTPQLINDWVVKRLLPKVVTNLKSVAPVAFTSGVEKDTGALTLEKLSTEAAKFVADTTTAAHQGLAGQVGIGTVSDLVNFDPISGVQIDNLQGIQEAVSIRLGAIEDAFAEWKDIVNKLGLPTDVESQLGAQIIEGKALVDIIRDLSIDYSIKPQLETLRGLADDIVTKLGLIPGSLDDNIRQELTLGVGPEVDSLESAIGRINSFNPDLLMGDLKKTKDAAQTVFDVISKIGLAEADAPDVPGQLEIEKQLSTCLLYTSDAADE